MTSSSQSAWFRTRRFRIAAVAAILFFPVILHYGMRQEAQKLEVRREQLELASWQGNRPLRILHLSDLHVSDQVPWQLLERAADLGLAERPDLIFITGDFVTNPFVIPDRDHCLAFLRRLNTAAPTFACLGNHDMLPAGTLTPPEEPVITLLHDAGIVLLKNTATTITIHGQAVHLAGTGDLWSGDLQPRFCLQNRRPEPGLALLLSHNPDGLEELERWDWDVLFCGHSHGGQLKIPLLGQRPLSPTRRHDCLAGLSRRGNGRLIETTVGVGNLHGYRLNCRPEIAILEINGKPNRENPSSKPSNPVLP